MQPSRRREEAAGNHKDGWEWRREEAAGDHKDRWEWFLFKQQSDYTNVSIWVESYLHDLGKYPTGP